MTYWKRTLLGCAGAAVLVCATAPIDTALPFGRSSDDATAFVDVTVIPMSGDERLLENQTVVVEEDRIVRVGPVDATEVPDGAVVVDGRGRYLVPGLCDMHVHVEDASELSLYAGYGVTTVLNLRGLPVHLRWRERIGRGELFGPTLYTTGDYIDGYPATMSPMMSFENDEAIRRSVERQKEAGYDLLKVYASLSPEQLEVVGEAARANGLAVTGHTSDNYTLEHSLRCGQVNVAHVDQLFRFLDEDRDEAGARALARSLRDAGASVTTTIGAFAMLVRHFEDLDAILAQPEAKRLHPAVLQPWRRENHRFLRRGEEGYERQKSRNAEIRWLSKLLHDEGVDLILGTDASTVGAYPGWSVYEELRELVGAGLDPWEALATATVRAGEFVRRHVDPDARFGQIRPGFRADLLLLEGNPLADVARVLDPLGVMMRGEWHPRQRLDEEFDAVEASSRKLSPAVLAFEARIRAGDIDGATAIFDETRAKRPDAMLFQHYWLYYVGFRFLYDGDDVSEDPEQLRIATGIYEMYAETFPEYHSSHLVLGRAYAASGRREEAIRSFERSLSICPGYVYAERELAEILSDDAATVGP